MQVCLIIIKQLKLYVNQHIRHDKKSKKRNFEKNRTLVKSELPFDSFGFLLLTYNLDYHCSFSWVNIGFYK